MTGAAYRLIKKRGKEYDIRNASGGGGRSTPSYSPDGSIIGVLESRGMPKTVTLSDGSEAETRTEIRVVPDDQTIRPEGDADGYPTKLDHPNDTTYRVIDRYEEDGGVIVLTVIED
ncbi:hypothetical protein [Haloarcula montana]|uniref:hypothetical protein n=1 Tax=Haloarcula montana TaxID=3111776 RepID=UPI002D786337|nr:hypothetical protein [Haloarcula sp. GH36]